MESSPSLSRLEPICKEEPSSSRLEPVDLSRSTICKIIGSAASDNDAPRNFQGFRLHHLDLSHLRLRCDFSKADLTAVNFKGATLLGSKFWCASCIAFRENCAYTCAVCNAFV